MTFEVKKRTVWQVASGSIERPYAHKFLKYGVALIGPGDPGPWRPEESDKKFDSKGYVRRFADELSIGDILLLRTGRSTICAVGLVASEYLHLPQFDDVNGWDVQHCRRVRWRPLFEPHDFKRQVFGAIPRRISRVHVADILEYANRFVQSPPTDWQTMALPQLPDDEPELREIPSALQELIAQVQDLSNLYWDTGKFEELPTEDELVAHNVIPFLRALGWPIEQIAVKWRHIDVCVFSALPRTAGNCHYLIEAKRLGKGLEYAREQGMAYVSDRGVSCNVVVTDGVRYRLCDASKGFEPVAYANLARLKQSSLKLFDYMRKPCLNKTDRSQ